MSMELLLESCFTAKPKSAMTAVPFAFTRTFLDFRSLNEAQDVLMSEHDCLINFCFAKPRPLVSGGENLHGHILSSPLSPPHLPKPTLPNRLLQDNEGDMHDLSVSSFPSISITEFQQAPSAVVSQKLLLCEQPADVFFNSLLVNRLATNQLKDEGGEYSDSDTIVSWATDRKINAARKLRFPGRIMAGAASARSPPRPYRNTVFIAVESAGCAWLSSRGGGHCARQRERLAPPLVTTTMVHPRDDFHCLEVRLQTQMSVLSLSRELSIFVRVFLMRNAVNLADGFWYQHSFMSLAMETVDVVTCIKANAFHPGEAFT
ncbi:hypothetical protein EYF80_005216 [Liparis tanakae]|uniref:Uncharacterized protein n=1 Tax=Liparis tanakae TaxID=230148 RepID=A0A4Z2J2V9_9TELE|nr:hypothetical protein EYF80_005216 [Liparis tanakae]